MMKNNKKALMPLFGSALVIFGLLLGVFLARNKQTFPKSIEGKYSQKLIDIIEVLDKEYVDSIDKKELFEKAINDLLHDLDPHSNYIAAEELAALNESIQGKFGGVGIRFTIYDDTLNVVNVIENSPSFYVGIQKFDQIIQVEGENIAGVGISNEQVRKILRGTAGTPVHVVVLRKGKEIPVQIVRGDVPLESISASYMIDEKTGYIRLGQFSLQSAKEFYLAALRLKEEGMENLIFDLRYNGGGVLNSAVSILETMLKKGTPIVSTKGKNTPETVIYSSGKPFLENIEIAVLINSSSASASEIVAGAIQDNDRGTIIGRRSFGKGLVQQDIPLKDGSNLRLTVSRYYTPTGRSIQKPYSGKYEDYMMDEIHRYESGELYHIDSSLLLDSLKYTTPKGKVVYGGGGIMPDIFVPLDTAKSSVYFRKLQYANAFNDFSYTYVRFNDLSQYPTIQDFSNNFNITESVLERFKKYAEEKLDIPLNKKGYQHSLPLIKRNLKAEIARQKWLELGFFYIYNQSDKEVKIAIEAFEKEDV